MKSTEDHLFCLPSGLDHWKRLRIKETNVTQSSNVPEGCLSLHGGDSLLPFSCAAASLEPRPWAAAGRGLFSAALFAAPRCSPFSLQLCQPSGPALRIIPWRNTLPEVCLELSQRLGTVLPCQQTEGWRPGGGESCEKKRWPCSVQNFPIVL